MNRSTSSLAVSRWAGGVFNKFTLLSLAITSILMFLVSCGDTVYESKGGGSGTDYATGTINVYVRNGAGDGVFADGGSGVTVTLQNSDQAPQKLSKSGAVTFKNVQPGDYEVRIDREGYATSFYSAKYWPYKGDGEVGSTGYTGGTVNVQAVLYPLTASLTGTVNIQKPDGTISAADSATVRIEVGVDRRVQVVEAGDDIKIEHRIFTTTTNRQGVYTFEELPAVPSRNSADNPTYKLVALGREFDGVFYADLDLPIVDLVAGGLPAVNRSATYTVTARGLNLLNKGEASVTEGSDPIVFKFSEELDASKISGATINTGAVIATASVSGSNLTLTPVKSWSSYTSGQTFDVEFTNLYSKSGNVYSGKVTVSPTRTFISFGVQNADAGIIEVADSTSPIVLDFSHEIEDTKSAALSKNIIPGQAYAYKVEGTKLTLTPSQGWWSGTVGGVTLVLQPTVVKSVATSAWYTGGNVTVKLRNNSIKFYVDRDANWIGNYIQVAKPTDSVTVTFSDNIAVAPGKPRIKVFIDGSEYKVDVTVGTKKIVVPPPSSGWDTTGSNPHNDIEFEDIVSASGETLSGLGNGTNSPLEIRVFRVSGYPLIILNKDFEYEFVSGVDWAKEAVVVAFNEAVDTVNLLGKIHITGTQPTNSNKFPTLLQLPGSYTVSKDGKTLEILPVADKWKQSTFYVAFKEDLRSEEGVAISGSKTYVSVSKPALDISGVGVTSLAVDFAKATQKITYNNDVATWLRWVKPKLNGLVINEVDGYFVEAIVGGAKVNTFTIPGDFTGFTYHENQNANANDEYDSLYIEVPFAQDAATTYVVRPFADNGTNKGYSVGKDSRVTVEPRLKIALNGVGGEESGNAFTFDVVDFPDVVWNVDNGTAQEIQDGVEAITTGSKYTTLTTIVLSFDEVVDISEAGGFAASGFGGGNSGNTNNIRSGFRVNLELDNSGKKVIATVDLRINSGLSGRWDGFAGDTLEGVILIEGIRSKKGVEFGLSVNDPSGDEDPILLEGIPVKFIFEVPQ